MADSHTSEEEQLQHQAQGRQQANLPCFNPRHSAQPISYNGQHSLRPPPNRRRPPLPFSNSLHRPPGSKNKSKPPVHITPETEPAMKARQLEIPAGCDVVQMVQKFARKHQVGVHVINGYGSVSNVTLRQAPITLAGTFSVISLSGTVIGHSICLAKENPAPSAAPWLTIFVGGTVIGKVTATSRVVLNVSTFGNYEYHKVDPVEYDAEEEDEGCGRRRLAVKVESVSSGVGALGFAVSAEHLNWAPPPVATRPLNHHF